MTKIPEIVADSLPQAIAAGIGLLIYRWGRLEYQLSNLIEVACDLQKDTGRVLTIGMDIKVKCSVLRTLTRTDRWVKDEDIRDEIKRLAREIVDKVSDRHDYAHGVLGFTMDEPNTFARYLFNAPEHRIDPSMEPVTPESLKELSDEALGLVDRAIDLTVRLIASKSKSA